MIQRADPRLTLVDPTVNEALLDAAIRHAHFIERLKSGEVAKIVGLLNRYVIPDLIAKLANAEGRVNLRGVEGIRTQRFRDLLAALDEIVRAGFSRLQSDTADSMVEIGRFESAWQVRTLSSAVPLEFDFVVPSAETLRAVVTAKPMQGALLKDWWGDLARKTQIRVRREINIGIVQGEDIDAIVRRLRGTRALKYTDGVLQESRRAVAGIVRTAVNHVSTHARESVYEANADIIKGVEMVATLDTRTSDECKEQDGKVYPVGVGPRPPFHPGGCRTTTVPVTKSWRELGIRTRPKTEGARASMGGEVPASTTYYQWLARQSAAVQDEALGKGRGALFRRGEVSADRFVDDAGRALTLAQLEALEAAG